MTHYAMVIDLNTCTGCNACMAACAAENQTPFWSDEWRTYVHDREVGTGDDIKRRFFPRLCNHCDNPPCLTVCPTGATYKLDNGIVMVDQDTCMGCQACAVACPYDARYPYRYGDVSEAKAVFGEEHAHHHRPSVDKCDFCYHRLQAGKEPACVATCIGESRLFGDLDNPDDEVTKIVDSGRAQPLLPHLGTRPNVYYIAER
jgi:Fe-S-cluster-containing dehydrogenase component